MRRALILLAVFTFFSNRIFGQLNKTIFSDNVLVVRHDAETAPSFLLGSHGWQAFLEKNLNADIARENNAPNGEYQVRVDVVVDAKGKPRSFTPLSHYGYGMEEEAIRVLKLTLWKPGTLKGRPVNTLKRITIIFFVETYSNSI